MAQRSRSIFGPALIIGIGVLLLVSNLWPGVDPWPFISRYWPLLLVFIGLAKLWDRFQTLPPGEAPRPILSGGEITLIVLILIFGGALTRGSASSKMSHTTETVDRKDADSARIDIEMGAGRLKVGPGTSKLLEATFDFSEAEGMPRVDYNVVDKEGRLNISQSGRGIHFGRTRNTWDLRLNKDVPSQLHIKMGAGENTLNLGSITLSRLEIEMGAGELNLDLRGNWKKDLDAEIHGGAGEANIYLPRDVGVRVYATGGIGSINASGLRRDGATYINDAYGKSPVTLRVNVQGGVGEINLISGS